LVTAQTSKEGGQRTGKQGRSEQDMWSESRELLRDNVQSPAASKLAHARYATQACVDRKFGGPFNWGSEFGIEELSPALRSARIYLVVYNCRWPTNKSAEKNLVLCFQRTGQKLKLVYSFPYTFPTGPNSVSSVAGKPKTLLDYLNARGFLPTGRLSAEAQRDINSVREYVRYGINPYTSTLEIYMASDMGGNGHGPVNVAFYNRDLDMLTDKGISTKEFYRRYGLPIPKRELDLLEPKRK
jgi:hypothetical protein